MATRVRLQAAGQLGDRPRTLLRPATRRQQQLNARDRLTTGRNGPTAAGGTIRPEGPPTTGSTTGPDRPPTTGSDDGRTGTDRSTLTDPCPAVHFRPPWAVL